MPTVDEIRDEWKGIRSALGNLICYIDGKTEQLPDLERSWQKGYDCGYKDGYKAGADSVVTDNRELVKTRWDDCSVYKRYKPEPKPITHGDQLRAMSDEKLAAWIETFAPSGTFQFWLNGKTWLQWLRQEAGRDERTD